MKTITLPCYVNGKGKARENGTFEVLDVPTVKGYTDSHIWFVGVQGDARQAKVNGKIRTWKRDANRVEVSLKYGLHEYATFDTSDINAGRLLRRLG